MLNPASLNIGGISTTRFELLWQTVVNISIGISTTRLPPYQTYYERTRPTYSYRWINKLDKHKQPNEQTMKQLANAV